MGYLQTRTGPLGHCREVEQFCPMVGQSPCHMEKVGLGLETIATMLTRRQPFVPLAPTGKKRTQRLPEAKNEEQKLILKGYGYYANEELVPATGDIFPSIFNQPKLSLFSEMEMGKTGSGNFNVRRVLVWLGTCQIDIDAKEELRFESVVEFLRDEDKETFKRASKFGEGVLDGAFTELLCRSGGLEEMTRITNATWAKVWEKVRSEDILKEYQFPRSCSWMGDTPHDAVIGMLGFLLSCRPPTRNGLETRLGGSEGSAWRRAGPQGCQVASRWVFKAVPRILGACGSDGREVRERGERERALQTASHDWDCSKAVRAGPRCYGNGR